MKVEKKEKKRKTENSRNSVKENYKNPRNQARIAIEFPFHQIEFGLSMSKERMLKMETE